MSRISRLLAQYFSSLLMQQPVPLAKSRPTGWVNAVGQHGIGDKSPPTCLISPDHIPNHIPRKTWRLMQAWAWLPDLMRRLTRS